MMALARNGFDSPLPASSSGKKQDLQHPSRISRMSSLFSRMLPCRRVCMLGRSPGFLTMYAISFLGSPPTLKNSRPASWTKERNVSCVAIRIRWPASFRATPRATNGWTSPREPTTWMTMFILGGVTLIVPDSFVLCFSNKGISGATRHTCRTPRLTRPSPALSVVALNPKSAGNT